MCRKSLAYPRQLYIYLAFLSVLLFKREIRHLIARSGPRLIQPLDNWASRLIGTNSSIYFETELSGAHCTQKSFLLNSLEVTIVQSTGSGVWWLGGNWSNNTTVVHRIPSAWEWGGVSTLPRDAVRCMLPQNIRCWEGTWTNEAISTTLCKSGKCRLTRKKCCTEFRLWNVLCNLSSAIF